MSRIFLLWMPLAAGLAAAQEADNAPVPSERPPAADQEAANAAYRQAEAAYQASARGEHAAAAQAAREAVRLAPGNPSYRLLLVNALMSAGELAQADQAATEALGPEANQPEMLAARSRVRSRRGDAAAAAADAEAALRLGGLAIPTEIDLLLALGRPGEARQRFASAQAAGRLAGERDADLAYLAIRVGDDEAALAAFNRADAKGALPDSARLDAAYTASRLARNDEAIAHFRKALAAAEAGRLNLTPQQRFDVSRAIADRARRWGSFVSLSYRGMVPSGLASAPPGARNDSLQGSIEAYWRPWGYRDGSYAELYGGLLETLYSKGDFTTGAPSAQGSLGLRVKPLSGANLVLAVERRVAVGSKATSDTLARMAYSSSHGTDLRVDAPSWTTAQLYAEVGRYRTQRLNYGTMEATLGRSYRLDAAPPRTVVFPHVVFGSDYNSRVSDGQEKGATGAGVGVGLRHWFNAALGGAPRSYMDLSLQYRGRLGGDERAKGVFLRATVAY